MRIVDQNGEAVRDPTVILLADLSNLPEFSLDAWLHHDSYQTRGLCPRSETFGLPASRRVRSTLNGVSGIAPPSTKPRLLQIRKEGSRWNCYEEARSHYRPFLTPHSPPAFSQGLRESCNVTVTGQNRNRLVNGAANAECDAGLHSAPFGNWGVRSNYRRIKDMDQFRGLKWRDGLRTKRQWTSCTTRVEQYRAPDPLLYVSWLPLPAIQ